ncbi:hypothetical protein GF336_02630 [Candidatus Woesearchaeota archaeon]|nr:hypothetical protein [Candidatus Woesearchaeota archaeon]
MGDMIDYIKYTVMDLVMPATYVELIRKMGEDGKSRIMYNIDKAAFSGPVSRNNGSIDNLFEYYISSKKKHGFF